MLNDDNRWYRQLPKRQEQTVQVGFAEIVITPPGGCNREKPALTDTVTSPAIKRRAVAVSQFDWLTIYHLMLLWCHAHFPTTLENQYWDQSSLL